MKEKLSKNQEFLDKMNDRINSEVQERMKLED